MKNELEKEEKTGSRKSTLSTQEQQGEMGKPKLSNKQESHISRSLPLHGPERPVRVGGRRDGRPLLPDNPASLRLRVGDVLLGQFLLMHGAGAAAGAA